jgi:hypothetical protein
MIGLAIAIHSAGEHELAKNVAMPQTARMAV